jgi:hypothetical protein
VSQEDKGHVPCCEPGGQGSCAVTCAVQYEAEPLETNDSDWKASTLLIFYIPLVLGTDGILPITPPL